MLFEHLSVGTIDPEGFSLGTLVGIVHFVDRDGANSNALSLELFVGCDAL